MEWCGMVWNGVGVEFSFASRRWGAHNLIRSSRIRGTARRTEYAGVRMIKTMYWR